MNQSERLSNHFSDGGTGNCSEQGERGGSKWGRAWVWSGGSAFAYSVSPGTRPPTSPCLPAVWKLASAAARGLIRYPPPFQGPFYALFLQGLPPTTGPPPALWMCPGRAFGRQNHFLENPGLLLRSEGPAGLHGRPRSWGPDVAVISQSRPGAIPGRSAVTGLREVVFGHCQAPAEGARRGSEETAVLS